MILQVQDLPQALCGFERGGQSWNVLCNDICNHYYDNIAKGFLANMELPPTFTGVEQLVEDFIAAVAARRAP